VDYTVILPVAFDGWKIWSLILGEQCLKVFNDSGVEYNVRNWTWQSNRRL